MPQPKNSPRNQRRLRRFFSAATLSPQIKNIALSQEESSHLQKTLRLEPGDRCLVTDGCGMEAEAEVSGFQADGCALLSILKITHSQVESRLHLCLYPALLQRGKTDECVRMAQELGAEMFTAVMTERTLLKVDSSAAERMCGRWMKIAAEAAKQSGNLKLCDVRPPRLLNQALKEIPKEETLVFFHPDLKATSFKDWIAGASKETRMHLFFGPEGGFSPKEIQLFEDREKTMKVHLGAAVLKADTAFIGAASAVRFLCS